MSERAKSHRLRIGRISGTGQIYLVTAKTLQRKPAFSDWRMGVCSSMSFGKSMSSNWPIH
ncbi:hypothetical protein ALP68_00001 [Pseudomonas ficuserectae]|uniref:Uncharacterized protein n=1 Tax=Pseudomonas amygdali pv. mori TaxID=34065 RepID=A0A0P9W890_PSEA0|nr:Uncharacterized protein ALO69_03024 [Pseudomonas ficuserectae]KPY00790.1 Uncharacterized protein ALO63_00161 [Pseudomonas amygdali pv. mori]RMS38056.1 hypothetical protein ALP68_00001 [Pseudomonas ficuserectae]RMS38289.1 hypothetical protein ALP67_03275 [Pseudomonas ficuserectae]